MSETMKRLTPVADGLWVCAQPLKMLGLELGARMTLVRLTDDSLWVHSPVRPDDELVEEIKGLGEVSAIVAPNRFHHLFATAFAGAFPAAHVYAAPGLAKKNPGLTSATELDHDAIDAWRNCLDQRLVDGMPMLNEVAFCHRPTRTLITCDLAFNIGSEMPWSTRTIFRMLGAYNKLGPSLVERMITKDRAKTRAALEEILSWDFDRVVVSHGRIAEGDVKTSLAAGYRWLLK